MLGLGICMLPCKCGLTCRCGLTCSSRAAGSLCRWIMLREARRAIQSMVVSPCWWVAWHTPSALATVIEMCLRLERFLPLLPPQWKGRSEPWEHMTSGSEPPIASVSHTPPSPPPPLELSSGYGERLRRAVSCVCVYCEHGSQKVDASTACCVFVHCVTQSNRPFQSVTRFKNFVNITVNIHLKRTPLRAVYTRRV